MSLLKQMKIILVSSAALPSHSLVLCTDVGESRGTSLFTYISFKEDASHFSWHSRASRKVGALLSCSLVFQLGAGSFRGLSSKLTFLKHFNLI